MSQFLIVKKGCDLPEEIVDFEKAYESSEYSVYFSGNYISRDFGKNGKDFLLGSSLYLGKRITQTTFSNIDFNIEALSEHSGRYLFLSVRGSELRIVSSILGSFPCYYSKNFHAIGSSERLVSKTLGTKLSLTGLKERLTYNINYKDSLFSDVFRVGAGVVTTFNESGLAVSDYLESSVKQYAELSLDAAIKLLAKKFDENTRAYFDNERKACISYTGGRDSRMMLCQLMRVLPKDRINTFTVGDSNDQEYFVGAAFTSKFNIKHDLFEPDLLDEEKIDTYANTYGDINFPCMYKDQMREYLKAKYAGESVDFLNTHVPETLLCHLDYLQGEEHPAINFMRGRASGISTYGLLDNDSEITAQENAAIQQWETLRSRLPNDVITNIIFSSITFQRDWAYKVLRPYDMVANVVCIMEDPEILSILASMKLADCLNDKLYRTLMLTSYPEGYEVPTTRDINLSAFKKIRLVNIARYLPLMLKAGIFAGSLATLLKNNKDFIVGYCNENKSHLISLFGEGGTDSLLKSLNEGVYLDNRVDKIINLFYKRKKTLKEYELISPLCAIALLNNNDHQA